MVVPSLKAGMPQSGNPERRSREVYPGCSASSFTLCGVFANPSGTVSSAAQALSKPTPNSVSTSQFLLYFNQQGRQGKRKKEGIQSLIVRTQSDLQVFILVFHITNEKLKFRA